MPLYRKKPVVIEARRFDADVVEQANRLRAGRTALEQWCGGTIYPEEREMVIPTLEGEMTASLCDWIIRGVKGEFYPCKPDIFEATYEPAETPERVLPHGFVASWPSDLCNLCGLLRHEHLVAALPLGHDFVPCDGYEFGGGVSSVCIAEVPGGRYSGLCGLPRSAHAPAQEGEK